MSRIEDVQVQLFSVGLHSFDAEAFFQESTSRWVPLHEKPIRVRMKFAPEVADLSDDDAGDEDGDDFEDEDDLDDDEEDEP